ncbi:MULTISPECIES: hypothetical protein [Vibrio]|uniref:DUF1311 domain-containing protein n=1 Tax=Vibrio echinoideorum TaxID=2100116 RepID=A0ABU9FQ70_9VIBR|nr:MULTISPECIES: hypothetical protein [Vibrio]MCF7502257.1 hypothetical protein [Vibrio sp. L3-7]OED71476.1 hypothetical protein A143_17910 [Vibrio splendidus ZS-139]TVU79225.1 hypothetical protein FQP87_02070 [Vibrio tasmaniensis]
MYELTLILSLMMGGADSTAEMEVNTQFTTLEQCNEEGAALAEKLNTADLKVMQVQCERD